MIAKLVKNALDIFKGVSIAGLALGIYQEKIEGIVLGLAMGCVSFGLVAILHLLEENDG